MVFQIWKNKRWYSLLTLFFFSVLLPFFLYLAGWSTFFTKASDILLYIISTFEVLIILCSFLPDRTDKRKRFSYRNKILKIGKLNISWAYIMIFFVFSLSLAENLYVAHSFCPFLQGIDVHVSTMPIVGPLIRVLLPISLAMDYLEFRQNKSFVIVAASFLEILYIVLGIGSRYWFLASMIFFVFFIVFIEKIDMRRISLRLLSFVLLLGVFAIAVVVFVGQKRIGAGSFSSYIQYTGPFSGTLFGEIISWYYGYFPGSYEVLNLSTQAVFEGNIYTDGKIFLMPWESILQIRRFLPYSLESLLSSVTICPNPGMIVPTAFLYFYADFGYFFFITPAFYIGMYWISKQSDTLFGYGVSAFLVTVFCLFSFTDMFSSAIPLWFTIIFWVVQKFLIASTPRISVVTEAVKI